MLMKRGIKYIIPEEDKVSSIASLISYSDTSDERYNPLSLFQYTALLQGSSNITFTQLVERWQS